MIQVTREFISISTPESQEHRGPLLCAHGPDKGPAVKWPPGSLAEVGQAGPFQDKNLLLPRVI